MCLLSGMHVARWTYAHNAVQTGVSTYGYGLYADNGSSINLICTPTFMGMQLRVVAMLPRPYSETLDHHDLMVVEGVTMWL